MDILLFERYGLDINEADSDVINAALEKNKSESKWEKNLNAKNDKIRSNAKEKQARWNEDKEILTDSARRSTAAKEITRNIESIVNYIDDHGSDEKKFDNAVYAFIEMNLTADDIRAVYEKYRSEFSSYVDPEKVNMLKTVVRELAKPYGSFINITKNLEDNIFSKFYENGIDLTDFAAALRLDECQSCEDIAAVSENISAVAYDIYNRKLMKDADKNAFMDIFSSNSNSANGLVKLLRNELFEELSAANWAIVKNVALTCKLMDSAMITSDSIRELPYDRQEDFLSAMKTVFGIKAENSLDASQLGAAQSYALPSEIKLGEAELKKSEFEKAENYFRTSVDKNPYCWQGYWGLFKSKIYATDDSEIYFPGFLDALNKRSRGEQVDEEVDLFARAKEIAIAQQSMDINFFNIENQYKEADYKAENLLNYEENLINNYNQINEAEIRHKGFAAFLNEFKQKAKVYNKHSDIANESVAVSLALLLLALYGIITGIIGLSSALTGSCSEVLAFASVAVGTAFGIALGFYFMHTIIGAIVSFGVTMFVGNMLTDAAPNAAISIAFLVAGIAIGAALVFRIVRWIRIKPNFGNETEELKQYVIENVAKCFYEELTEYYNNNNLMEYRIIIDESILEHLVFDNYFAMMNSTVII